MPTPTAGPWGSAPADESAPEEEGPRRQPRLREAQAPDVAASRPPRAPARRSDSIGEAIAKSAARTVTTIAVREASRAIFGSGRNSGILGNIVRGVLGGLRR
jgi:hypothetical protein